MYPMISVNMGSVISGDVTIGHKRSWISCEDTNVTHGRYIHAGKYYSDDLSGSFVKRDYAYEITEHYYVQLKDVIN